VGTHVIVKIQESKEPICYSSYTCWFIQESLEAPLWRVHKLDIETGAMEDITESFHCDVLRDAMPMETD
jgi:hypothetical protein